MRARKSSRPLYSPTKLLKIWLQLAQFLSYVHLILELGYIANMSINTHQSVREDVHVQKYCMYPFVRISLWPNVEKNAHQNPQYGRPTMRHHHRPRSMRMSNVFHRQPMSAKQDCTHQ
jgi:hypothetical protein